MTEEQLAGLIRDLESRWRDYHDCAIDLKLQEDDRIFYSGKKQACAQILVDLKKIRTQSQKEKQNAAHDRVHG